MVTTMQQVAQTAVRRIDKELDNYQRMVLFSACCGFDDDAEEEDYLIGRICEEDDCYSLDEEEEELEEEDELEDDDALVAKLGGDVPKNPAHAPQASTAPNAAVDMAGTCTGVQP